MKPTLFWPPGKTMSRYESPIGTIGKIAFRCGGRCAAVKSCVIAMYDGPHMPTLPLLHDCARRPLDDLVAVALLARAEVVPVPLRLAGAAHVDDDLHVAALDEVVVRRR